uniref:Uncharacterized protein n=1 Tax=Phakopsora pachyrhizi TaxID=170000 RepID=A0A0S1MJH3_PHAPC
MASTAQTLRAVLILTLQLPLITVVTLAQLLKPGRLMMAVVPNQQVG